MVAFHQAVPAVDLQQIEGSAGSFHRHSSSWAAVPAEGILQAGLAGIHLAEGNRQEDLGQVYHQRKEVDLVVGQRKVQDQERRVVER